MMAKTGLWLILCLHAFSHSLAQQINLSGFISDAATGEKLAGVSVYAPSLKSGTVTNEFGYYILTIPSGLTSVEFVTLSYEKKILELQLKENTRVDVELNFNQVLQELTVTPDDENDIVNSTQMSVHRITNQIISKSTILLGESDLLKTIQLLPGVKSGNEGFAGIYIRGGTPDQNLILLDGVPVYNVNHLFGFLSTFNTDVIKDAVLFKGGIPARFGNRLSSVLDISLKEGNLKKVQGSFALSPIAGRFSLEGPVKKNVSSYILSFRRSWLDSFSNVIYTADQKASYSFYDFNFKYNHSINLENKITVSAFLGNDKFFSRTKSDGEKSEYGFDWGNGTFSIQWNRIFNPRLFGTFLIYQTKYSFTQVSETVTNSNRQSRFVESNINEKSLQADFEYNLNNKNKIRFGSKVSFLNFEPEILQVLGTASDTTINAENSEQSWNAELYLEQDSKLTDKLLMNLGLREAFYITAKKNYTILQPRLSLTYLLSNQTSLKASFNRMGQFVHLLTNSSIGFPTDLWVPSTDLTAPEKSIQYAMGVNHVVREVNVEASLEFYYKKMDNLLEYRDGANYLYGSKNWEDKVIYGEGEAYGVEFFINRKKGVITGWVGYTLSYNDRKFTELNNGEKFPFKYDRRHDLSIYGNYALNEKKSFSIVFVLSSGNLATVPVNSFQGQLPPNFNLTPRYQSGQYPDDFVNQELIINRNNYRLPLYHRLDLNYQTTKKTKRENRRTWLFSVYNAYSRLNPFLLYQSEGSLKKLTLFPIIPSITYRLDF